MSSDEGRETLASVWTPRQHGRPARRPALTREAIVDAAVKVADAEGLAAVSMRRIAAELGARVMSLYHHVARKEDLLTLMADAVTAEVLVPEPLPADWREAISLIARREREVAKLHPWMGDFVAIQLEIGPNMLRHGEQTAAALSGLGLSIRETTEVAGAIDHYVLGHTLRERWNLVAERGGDGAPDTAELVKSSPVFAELRDRGEIPLLASLVDEGIHVPSVTSFEQGLTWLLDGIEHDVVAGRSGISDSRPG
jgi:AcrR family transcriptional regulator